MEKTVILRIRDIINNHELNVFERINWQRRDQQPRYVGTVVGTIDFFHQHDVVGDRR